MHLKIKVLLFFTLGAFAGLISHSDRAWADLQQYVLKPEAEFTWTLKGTYNGGQPEDRVHDLALVSQVWQKHRWQHQLQIYQPRSVVPASTMFLWVTGGAAAPRSAALGMELARRIGAPVAFLYHVPNQPLLENNLAEDDLIAETFVRYLKTRDENWPLLFPMVKSVVKAMDALRGFGEKEWGKPIDKFIVAGASKRGWTTWLAAAVDPRIEAIVPVVIDTLNMRVQMRRQLQAFGAYSARLAPYSSRGLLPIPETPEGQRLLRLVDPWAYRDKLTMPKLIVNGTNDFYWATDALNQYWSGIPPEKWALYLPNAGHNLRRQDRAEPDQMTDFLNGLAAFSRHQISGTPMPRLRWKHETVDGKLRLTIAATPAPKGARLWVAEKQTADFRAAQWHPHGVTASDGNVIGEITPPAKGYTAFFGELDYEIEGLPYHLSTQMRVTN